MLLALPKIFSQRDAQWRRYRLGKSRLTVGGYGCLITSYAMVLAFFGRKTNPGMVNRLISKYNGYNQYGLYYWQTLAKIYGYNQKVVDAQNRALHKNELQEIIDTITKKKIPVIIQVDMNPNTAKANMHFVVAYGYEGGKLYIADPWTGQTGTLRAKYFGVYIKSLRRAIYRYVIFSPKGYNQKPIANTKPLGNYGVDISHYQGDVDFRKVKKSMDFVIMKATESTNYIDKTFVRNRQRAKEAGILQGFYHFARGGDVIKEADHFIETIDHLNKYDLLVLDWEINHDKPVEWCKKWLDRVFEKTGVRPLLYTNEARVKGINWKPLVNDYGLWVARYHQNDGKMHGVPNTGPWATYILYQYTSRGRVSGINGNVDMNYCPHGLDVLKRYGAQNNTIFAKPEPPQNDDIYCYSKDYKKKYHDKKKELAEQKIKTESLQNKLRKIKEII